MVTTNGLSRAHSGGRTWVPIATGCAIVALLVAGCSPSTSAESTPAVSASSPSASPAASSPAASAESPCALLDDEELVALVGSAEQGVEVTVPGSDFPACQYGDITATGIQVARIPADSWAQSLPAIIASVRDLPEGSVPPNVLQQLDAAVTLLSEGETVTPEEACSYFSLVAEATGNAAGTDVSVTFYPDKASAIAVLGQQCASGRFTSLVVGRPDAAGNDALVDAVGATLQRLR